MRTLSTTFNVLAYILPVLLHLPLPITALSLLMPTTYKEAKVI